MHIILGRGIFHRTTCEYYKKGEETIRPKVAGDFESNPNKDLDNLNPQAGLE